MTSPGEGVKVVTRGDKAGRGSLSIMMSSIPFFMLVIYFYELYHPFRFFCW